MKIKKNFITRLITAAIAALTISICCSFCAVSVIAAEPITADTMANTSETDIIVDEESGVITFMNNEFTADEQAVIVQLGGADGGADDGDGDGDGDGGTSSATSSDSAFQTVVGFFVKWMRRVGALVGFIGAIMFGLAIKNNDADQKQNGLTTLVAGFVVWAICQAVHMFDIFS